VVPTGVDAYGIPMTAVGDSVMLAARHAILDEFPHVTVDAAISRQSDVIYSRVRARLAAGQLASVVVIHAGTNGTVKQADLESLLVLLRDRARVVLVTDRAPRRWINESNGAIILAARKFAGGNVRVADWNRFSVGHPDWFYDDHIHMKAAGAAQYAQLIRDTLRS
jgi:lysophospholipase L1-like esterase